MTAAETMTELQMRLWCLWMCDKYAGLGGPVDSWNEAMRGAPKRTRTQAAKIDHAAWHVFADSSPPAHKVSLRAWELSEPHAMKLSPWWCAVTQPPKHVGWYQTVSRYFPEPEMRHWNGRRWSRVRQKGVAAPLFGLPSRQRDRWRGVLREGET